MDGSRVLVVESVMRTDKIAIGEAAFNFTEQGKAQRDGVTEPLTWSRAKRDHFLRVTGGMRVSGFSGTMVLRRL